MSLSPELDAIRNKAAYARLDDLRVVSVRGEDARAALLHLLPSRLFLRDAQARESLLLDEDGRPVADVLVCADDEDYLLLVEGLAPEALSDHLARHLAARPLDVEIEDLGDTHEVISLHGPWAWELVAAVLGDDLVALPYLNFFRVPQGWCVRAGKTGEFGYDIVTERVRADALMASLAQRGERLGARQVGAEALSLCRFESWFFDPRHVPEAATPLELQLQWRLDMEREFVGRGALLSRLASGVERRLTCLVASEPVAAGDPLCFGDRTIGRVVRAERSELRQEWVAAALVALPYAANDVDRYEVRAAAGPVRVRTAAPPLVNNRSLYVDPRRHVYAEADEIDFPPLVRGPRAPIAAR